MDVGLPLVLVREGPGVNGGFGLAVVRYCWLDFDVSGELFFRFSDQPEDKSTPAKSWVFVLAIPTSMETVSTALITGRSRRRLRSKRFPLGAAR